MKGSTKFICTVYKKHLKRKWDTNKKERKKQTLSATSLILRNTLLEILIQITYEN